jgi:hypothetical protein
MVEFNASNVLMTGRLQIAANMNTPLHQPAESRHRIVKFGWKSIFGWFCVWHHNDAMGELENGMSFISSWFRWQRSISSEIPTQLEVTQYY